MDKILINWDESYSVGSNIIDEQHKKLIELINKFFNLFSDGKANEAVPEILGELVNYTKYHFKTEEDLFKKFNYPLTDEHIEKHAKLIKKVNQWNEELKTNSANIHYDLIIFLKDWVIEHIKGDDKDYGQYFKENDIRF